MIGRCDGHPACLGRTRQAFARLGVTVRYFRAPGGDFGTTSATLRQLCQRYRTRPLGWSVDPQDQKPGVTKIVQTVPSTVSPGAVILPHDDGGTDRDQTMPALPAIISGPRGQGYPLAPLPPTGRAEPRRPPMGRSVVDAPAPRRRQVHGQQHRTGLIRCERLRATSSEAARHPGRPITMISLWSTALPLEGVAPVGAVQRAATTRSGHRRDRGRRGAEHRR